jgi:hypothetical protein
MEKDHDASSEDGSQNANNSAAEDGPGDSYSGDETNTATNSQLTSAKLQRVTNTSSARSKKSTVGGPSTSSKKFSSKLHKGPNP